MDGLDTIGEDGKIAWNAALTFIINGNTDDHLTMLEGGVVKRLLEDKWNIYAQVKIKTSFIFKYDFEKKNKHFFLLFIETFLSTFSSSSFTFDIFEYSGIYSSSR